MTLFNWHNLHNLPHSTLGVDPRIILFVLLFGTWNQTTEPSLHLLSALSCCYMMRCSFIGHACRASRRPYIGVWIQIVKGIEFFSCFLLSLTTNSFLFWCVILDKLCNFWGVIFKVAYSSDTNFIQDTLRKKIWIDSPFPRRVRHLLYCAVAAAPSSRTIENVMPRVVHQAIGHHIAHRKMFYWITVT